MMIAVSKETTSAIIVTFNPNQKIITSIIDSLKNQVKSIIIVDNGSNTSADEALQIDYGKNVKRIKMQKNVGLAAAQNIGIKYAKNLGAEYVLLLDQDSIPYKNMVAQLLGANLYLKENGIINIAAIGPKCVDSINGCISEHRRFGFFGVGHKKCDFGVKIVPVDYLIASGSLIEISTLDVVGLMEEGFFIDHIDTEWTLRAAALGFSSWGHCNAFMTHSMGDNRKSVWVGRWRNIPEHSPVRYYYVFRNGIVLHKRKYIDKRWKRIDYIRMVQYILYILFFHTKKSQSLIMATKGLFDGLKGIDGQMDQP